jgi:hypothetical protein
MTTARKARPRRKSWADRLNDPRPPVVKPVPIDIAGMKMGEVMLVPSARIVDAFIRSIPKGKSMDVPTLRRQLAHQFKAEVTCPITMGFHLRTVAEAAIEAHACGTRLADITPVWRVLDESAPTLRKLSAGADFILAQRRREGL